MKTYDFGAGVVIALFLLVGANMADKTTNVFEGSVNRATAKGMNGALTGVCYVGDKVVTLGRGNGKCAGQP